MQLLTDTHAHTLVSGHAYSTIKEMAQAASKRGLEALALTEHAPNMPGGPHAFYFMNFKVIPREMYGVHMLLGSELNILAGGEMDLPEELYKNLDIVIASMHTPQECYGLSRGMKEDTEAYLKVIEKPYVNIIGHPDDGRYEVDYEQLVMAAKKHHKLIEVNNSSVRPDSFRVGAEQNVRTYLELCKKYQVPIAVGSDAHIDVDAGNISKAIEIIESQGFPMELIASRDLEHLRPYLNVR